MLNQNKALKIGFSLLITFNLFLLIWQQKERDICYCHHNVPLWEQTIDFSKQNYSNETGILTGCYLVPNYIHFIRFDNPEITYVQMICILAAFKNQKPDKIYFHKNFNTSFEGKYWKILEKTKGFMDVVVFNYVPLPEDIFGQPLNPENPFTNYHASDITRLKMLMKYGGIVLDTDTYIVKSLNNFRTFEMTLNWDEDQFMATQLLIAHKDARFLKLYLETYRNAYNSTLWYYNAGERPTEEVLYKQPELIHRVKVLFGADTKYIHHVFQREWRYWKYFFAFHLLINHQYLLKNLSDLAGFPVIFDEKNIGYYPITFREMAYDVYDVVEVPWHKEYYADYV